MRRAQRTCDISRSSISLILSCSTQRVDPRGRGSRRDSLRGVGRVSGKAMFVNGGILAT